MPKSFSIKLKINFFINNGFDFNYWNLSNIFFSKIELYEYYKGNKDFKENFYDEKFFFSKNQVINYLKKINDKKTIFWCYDLNNFDDFWLRKSFKKYNLNYFVGPKRTPFINFILNKKNFNRYSLKRIMNAFKRRSNIKYYLNFINLYFFRKTNFHAHPLFVIGSGNLGKKLYENLFPKSEFLEVPSFDLDWNLENTSNNNEYIVYVDDAVDLGGKVEYEQRRNSYYMCTNLELFYKNLRNFFDKIEQIYKKKIIISASGKYYHRDYKKFGNRKVFYNQTNQLINKSFFIIGHESSGMWQAVISNKKIIIIDDISTSTPLRKNCIKNMAIFLDLKVNDLNKLSKKLIIEYFDSYDSDKSQLIFEFFSMKKFSKPFEEILLEKLIKVREI